MGSRTVVCQGLVEAGGMAGTGLEPRPFAPGRPPSPEKPSGFPDRLSPPHLTNPTSQLRSKGPPRLKTRSPTGYGANGSYYKRAPEAWEPSTGWAAACGHHLTQGQGRSLPPGRWGSGGRLSARHLTVITTPRPATARTTPPHRWESGSRLNGAWLAAPELPFPRLGPGEGGLGWIPTSSSLWEKQ